MTITGKAMLTALVAVGLVATIQTVVATTSRDAHVTHTDQRATPPKYKSDHNTHGTHLHPHIIPTLPFAFCDSINTKYINVLRKAAAEEHKQHKYFIPIQKYSRHRDGHAQKIDEDECKAFVEANYEKFRVPNLDQVSLLLEEMLGELKSTVPDWEKGHLWHHLEVAIVSLNAITKTGMRSYASYAGNCTHMLKSVLRSPLPPLQHVFPLIEMYHEECGRNMPSELVGDL